MKKIIYILSLACLMVACTSHPDLPATYTTVDSYPDIYPDYNDVVIPCNIAPLNFGVRGDVDECVAKFSFGSESTTFGEGHKVIVDEDEWKTMLESSKGKAMKVEVYTCKNGSWKKYKPFQIHVAEDSIDPYISYRLIYPSYVAFEMLSISQRNLTNFDESDIYNNMIISGEKDGQCINCHSYQNYHTANMQFHMRQGHGGTMIVRDNVPQKVNLKTDSTLSAGVYPAWHPTLPLIAYSTNLTGQTFHTKSNAKIEVQDAESDIILYDVEKNEVQNVCNEPNELENFPCWSPDGKYLYYGSAHFEYMDTVPHETEQIDRYTEIRYDIYRKPFNAQTKTFGEPELLYKASADSLSATFPRVSPDGKHLLFAMAPYGCFHVWHPDADLFMMDIATRKVHKLEEANSDRAESFHAWSSNGRWIVFISRRDDGNFSRLYFTYYDHKGRTHKAFELPQADPDFYTYFTRCYNVPEFMKEPVSVSAQTLAGAARKDAKQATYKSNGKGKGSVRPAKEAKHVIN